LKHGTGTDTYANGDTYTGQFENGKHHGKGTLILASSETYNGDFAKGMKTGQGKWKSSSKKPFNAYDGSYLDNMKHGSGTF